MFHLFTIIKIDLSSHSQLKIKKGRPPRQLRKENPRRIFRTSLVKRRSFWLSLWLNPFLKLWNFSTLRGSSDGGSSSSSLQPLLSPNLQEGSHPDTFGVVTSIFVFVTDTCSTVSKWVVYKYLVADGSMVRGTIHNPFSLTSVLGTDEEFSIANVEVHRPRQEWEPPLRLFCRVLTFGRENWENLK